MSVALSRGRHAHERREWRACFEALSRVDESTPLGVADLERLAESAYLLGQDDDYLRVLDRIQRRHAEAGEAASAARCAFWSGLKLMLRGETGRATGHFARAQRLIEGRDCVEHGYLGLVAFEERLAQGDLQGARDAAEGAAKIGERFHDADLVACGRQLQGKALLQSGRVDAGLKLLDEVMVAVTTGELSPIVTGLIYCNVIDACQQAYAVGRAREWTAALAGWCARQPQLVAFTTTCLIHRAEVLRLQGAWPDALAEARRASGRAASGRESKAHAAAFYQEAEVLRLRGESAAAEQAYARASRGGWDPQPGLALLRLAEGGIEAAASAIRRALGATASPRLRARLLPASVEILIAAGLHDEAAARVVELEAIAAEFDAPVLVALAAEARGALALATGDPSAALVPLRDAAQRWQQVAAPYLAARVRVLLGLTSRALGDEDGARLELDAARAVFAELGAAPDVARLEALAGLPKPQAGRLTPREAQVLRLVASGRTNKAIAAELSLSERTIERHVSNIFTKLEVSSRAAATAHAYRHGLV